MKRKRTAGVLALCVLAAASCRMDNYITIRGYAQGGTYCVKLNRNGEKGRIRLSPAAVKAAIDSIFQTIDTTLSGYDKGSMLSRFNRGEEIRPNRLFLEMYTEARRFWQETDGKVDVAAGALYDLWGFGFTGDSLPSPEKVRETLAGTGMKRLRNEIVPAADGSFRPESLLAGGPLPERGTSSEKTSIPGKGTVSDNEEISDGTTASERKKASEKASLPVKGTISGNGEISDGRTAPERGKASEKTSLPGKGTVSGNKEISDGRTAPERGTASKKTSIPESGTISGNGEISDGTTTPERGTPPLPRLNYNAVAQGYSCDLIARYLYRLGVKDMLVEVGEIYCDGLNPEGKGWKIGIDSPYDGNESPGRDIRDIWVSDGRAHGIVTSGNYRKFYLRDGKKYAHTLDPETGFPVTHNLLSATIVADDALTADALATYCMVIGPEQAVRFIESRDDLEGYLVFSEGGDMRSWASPGFFAEGRRPGPDGFR